MADRKLAKAMHVGGRWYKAGETVPDDVAEQIRNPAAFAADDGSDATGEDQRVEPGTDGGARLVTRVQVGGRWYGPDTPVPDDVAKQITNPRAWAGGKVPGGEPGGKPPYDNGGHLPPQVSDAAGAGATGSSDEGGDNAGATGSPDGEPEPAARPRRGTNRRD